MHWCEGLRQSEIQHLHRAIRSQLDVRWLQVPVDDALFMRRLEGFGDQPGDRHCFVEWQRPLLDAVGQRRAFNQLHHEGAAAVRPFEAINLRDVGMVQRGERLRLTLESRQPVGLMGKAVRQSLDGDLASKVGIERAIDLTHPTLADLGDDFVRPDASARHEGHGRWLQL
jgi:hypothetical protein